MKFFRELKAFYRQHVPLNSAKHMTAWNAIHGWKGAAVKNRNALICSTASGARIAHTSRRHCSKASVAQPALYLYRRMMPDAAVDKLVSAALV